MSRALANDPLIRPTQDTVLVSGKRANRLGDLEFYTAVPLPLTQADCSRTVLVGGKPIGVEGAYPAAQSTVVVGRS